MKVGIITFHCSYNFGSALQAYALQRAVTSLGNECLIIDYRSRDYDQYRLFHFGHPVAMVRDLISFRRNARRRSSFQAFWNNFFCLTAETYSFHDEAALSELSAKFDAFVCGSDQIWNLDCTRGVVGPFFLSFAGGRRRIAYAPSLAHTSFRQENFDRDEVARLLSQFDCLSVREKETIPLFQPLVDKKIEVVLDPTLLFDACEYEPMLGNPPEDDYIFVYLLRKCPDLVASARDVAKQTGKRVYYIAERPLGIEGAINCYGVGPERFVTLIAHAGLVLTNSFHATVFSVLYRREFQSFACDASGARIRDLLEELGIIGRCSSPYTLVDWNEVQSRMGALRNKSWSYLKEALA